jgi:hypothetical protein
VTIHGQVVALKTMSMIAAFSIGVSLSSGKGFADSRNFSDSIMIVEDPTGLELDVQNVCELESFCVYEL